MRKYFADLLLISIAVAVLFFCDAGKANAQSATQPGGQSALTSKPVVKDGLSINVTLAQPIFAAEEQPKFVVHFENVSKQTLSLFDADYFWDWRIQFTPLESKPGEAGPWDVQERILKTAIQVRPEPTTKWLAPGEGWDVSVDLNHAGNAFQYNYMGVTDHSIASIGHLAPGKYRLVVGVHLKENLTLSGNGLAKHWIGEITSEPVEFEIGGGTASQPADAPATQPAAAVPATQAGGGAALSSKTVVKDGLSITVTLAKPVFWVGDSPDFVVHFTNVSKQTLSLFDADNFWDWGILLTSMDKNANLPGPWRVVQKFVKTPAKPHEPTTKWLSPGESWDVPVDLSSRDGFFDYVYEGLQDDSPLPTNHLAPGKYQLVVAIHLKENTTLSGNGPAKHWIGDIVSEPAELAIVAVLTSGSAADAPATQSSN